MATNILHRHTYQHLTDTNPTEFLTINNLEMAAYIAHLHLFAPRMAPLEHISTRVDNTAAEIWARRGSVSTATAIGPLLREAAWITRQSKIHASIKRIPGVENIEADAAFDSHTYQCMLSSNPLTPLFHSQRPGGCPSCHPE